MFTDINTIVIDSATRVSYRSVAKANGICGEDLMVSVTFVL